MRSSAKFLPQFEHCIRSSLGLGAKSDLRPSLAGCACKWIRKLFNFSDFRNYVAYSSVLCMYLHTFCTYWKLFDRANQWRNFLFPLLRGFLSAVWSLSQSLPSIPEFNWKACCKLSFEFETSAKFTEIDSKENGRCANGCVPQNGRQMLKKERASQAELAHAQLPNVAKNLIHRSENQEICHIPLVFQSTKKNWQIWNLWKF